MNGLTATVETLWREIATRDAEDICSAAAVDYLPGENIFLLPSFGSRLQVDPSKKRILADDPAVTCLLRQDASFYHISVLWYLSKAIPAAVPGN